MTNPTPAQVECCALVAKYKRTYPDARITIDNGHITIQLRDTTPTNAIQREWYRQNGITMYGGFDMPIE